VKNILLAGLGLLLLSCFEQGDCSDYSSTELNLKFYNYSDKKEVRIALDSILMDGLDSVMYKADSISSVALPLDPAMDTATYHLYYNDTHAILGLSYQMRTFALAPDCDVIELITLKDAKGQIIQETKISTPDITSSGTTENIKLYF
jgi:hypothetical protein